MIETMERSCGGVVFRQAQDGLRFVLVRQLSGTVGFPKGRMEPGEKPEETAVREIFEETGLKVHLVPGFRATDLYPLRNEPGKAKEVTYFLAEITGGVPTPLPGEILEVLELPTGKTVDTLTFASARGVLIKALSFLSSRVDA